MSLPKNTVLEKAILKQAKSVRQYCKTAGFNYPSVLKLIQLREPIMEKRNPDEYRKLCRALSVTLDLPVDKLFQKCIYQVAYYAEQVAVAIADRDPIVDADEEAIASSSPLDEILWAKKRLHSILDRLPEREARFLLRRFLLEETLVEIGKAEGISPERARQIINRAVAKARGVKK